MFVQRILEFIIQCEKEGSPILCDVKLRADLFKYFSKMPAEKELNFEDIQFLNNCYKIRWEAIIDSENDYTRSSSKINQHWIDLAKKLEPLTQKSYLKILMPTITNDRDLNDFSLLTETVNLFNFFLGYGDSVLYRKLSFCRHLESREFVLSTFRTDKKLSVVTVDELARLKLCKEIKKQVSIGSDSYDSFWDLMRKRVFVGLSSSGVIPIGLLPHLVELVEKFYLLKSNEAEFLVFKNDLRNFFRRLYGCELSSVNALYGAKIKYKEDQEYLLDVFIALHTATNFNDIDYEIKALSQWLFELNPALKATSKELEIIIGRELEFDALTKKLEAIENCCRLLVSLLTTRFELFLFTGVSSSLWDISNNVFTEATTIFPILFPLIAANRPDELAVAYDKIIRDIILPAKNNKNFWTFTMRSESTQRWLENVSNCKFSEVGAYWFEPELIFFACLHFNTSNQNVKVRMNQFLDELIHTYTQDQNDLMKQFRVNTLFSEFLNGLSEHHRINLLRLMKLCDVRDAKATFLTNCIKYINDRLAQVCSALHKGFLSQGQFFPQLRKLNFSKLFKLPVEIRDVQSVVREYKIQLMELHLDSKIREVISSYLLKIGQPILSVIQKEIAKGCARTTDYLGHY